MAYGLSNGHVTDDLTWPWKVKLATAIRLERNISKTTWAIETSNLVCSLYREGLAGAQINFPESGRGLGHVTPTIFGSTVGYPSDSLASCTIRYDTIRQIARFRHTALNICLLAYLLIYLLTNFQFMSPRDTLPSWPYALI